MNTDSPPKIGYTKGMIEWRRNKVLHRLCMGWSQVEIAKELHLDPSTISLDVQYLKEQAKKDLQTHISERLPFEYNRAVTGINSVLKKVSELLDKAEDTKTKMECLKLQMELYRSVMSLATDGGIVERAMKMVKTLEPLPGETIPSEEEQPSRNLRVGPTGIPEETNDDRANIAQTDAENFSASDEAEEEQEPEEE
jgi:hypothetical protein